VIEGNWSLSLEPLELLMWFFVHGVLEEFFGAVKKAARNSCVNLLREAKQRWIHSRLQS
jgi:hypothetical protein